MRQDVITHVCHIVTWRIISDLEGLAVVDATVVLDVIDVPICNRFSVTFAFLHADRFD